MDIQKYIEVKDSKRSRQNQKQATCQRLAIFLFEILTLSHKGNMYTSQIISQNEETHLKILVRRIHLVVKR